MTDDETHVVKRRPYPPNLTPQTFQRHGRPVEIIGAHERMVASDACGYSTLGTGGMADYRETNREVVVVMADGDRVAMDKGSFERMVIQDTIEPNAEPAAYINGESEQSRIIDATPEVREAAEASEEFVVTDDGDVTLADGVEEATLDVGPLRVDDGPECPLDAGGARFRMGGYHDEIAFCPFCGATATPADAGSSGMGRAECDDCGRGFWVEL